MNELKKILEEIKELKCNQDSNNEDYKMGYISALSTIEGIISGMEKTENNGWIPVSKRLPEEYEEVLVWDNLNKRCLIVRFYDNDFRIGSPTIPFEPIAWRPLPGKYKEV